jgi:nucleoside 2-deoxyribosyltransferase
MSEQRCLIWQTPAEILPADSRRVRVSSSRAGGCYEITQEALAQLECLIIDKEKILLTCWLIEQRRLGVECPKIDNHVLDLIRQARPWSVHERADYLLRYLKRESTFLGRVFSFLARDTNIYPKMSSNSRALVHELFANSASERIEEIVTLAEFCDELKWLKLKTNSSTGSLSYPMYEIMLSPQGYLRVEELEETNSGSSEAFIAMWFDPSMDDAKKAIEAGITAAGYRPVRIDNHEHNKKIDDEIIAAIRRCRFLVADFTQNEAKGTRGGVYYEAGFAHGLSLPVIFTCQEESLEFVHFDTRQYNHIVWNNFEELTQRLSQRILATIGDGPLKQPM